MGTETRVIHMDLQRQNLDMSDYEIDQVASENARQSRPQLISTLWQSWLEATIYPYRSTNYSEES